MCNTVSSPPRRGLLKYPERSLEIPVNLGEFINVFIVLNVLIRVFALLKKAGGASNKIRHLLAPAVTVGETEGAMDSTSVLFFISSFAYNFARK